MMDASQRVPRVRLVAVTEAAFRWMLGRGDAVDELQLPEGGVDEAETIEHVRRLAERQDYDGSWMIVAGGEVVGLCGYHGPPVAGIVEIGYNVAPARRKRGFATHGVAALVRTAEEDDAIHTIVAETLADNVGSQRALERNAFVRVSERPTAGEPVIRWSRNVPRKTA
jgi:RimJ/RimL family protein N-acetyltransferase